MTLLVIDPTERNKLLSFLSVRERLIYPSKGSFHICISYVFPLHLKSFISVALMVNYQYVYILKLQVAYLKKETGQKQE